MGRVDEKGIVLRSPQPPVAGCVVLKGDHPPVAPGPEQDEIAAVSDFFLAIEILSSEFSVS